MDIMIHFLPDVDKRICNMLINRNINDFLAKRMFGGKVLIVYGPRQAGKTTSITAFLTERGLLGESLIFNGESGMSVG